MMSRISSGVVSGLLFMSCGLARSDEAALPGAGWPASRYEALWTKSPFAVETPQAAPESTEYSLWGIAQIDGVSYASLTNKQNNEHFLLGSDKPNRGLTLVSVTRGANGEGTSAVILKDGLSLTLKLEQGPAPQPSPDSTPASVVSQNSAQQDNSNAENPGHIPRPMPPPVIRHRPTLHIPPVPPQATPPVPAPGK